MKDEEKNLENRIEEAKQKLKEKYNPEPVEVVSPIKIVLDLISGIAVGAFAGYFLDDYFNKAPLFLLIFILIGAISGGWIVYKDINKIGK